MSTSMNQPFNRALRENGVCRGSILRQNNIKAKAKGKHEQPGERVFSYCVLMGIYLISYTDYYAYMRGDHPLTFQKIVGASAWNSNPKHPEPTFRMVTAGGTHLYCTAPSHVDCHTWLAAFQEGLEASYTATLIASPKLPQLKPLPNPKTKKPKKGMFGTRTSSIQMEQKCESCGRKAEIITQSCPLVQYGNETRNHICPECLVAQGVWLEIFLRAQLYNIHVQQESSLEQAKQTCFATIFDSEEDRSQGMKTVGQANSLRDLVSSPEFGVHRRLCPKLEYHCASLELGHLAPAEFVELVLEDTSNKERIALKKQALDVAGDMGSAMKLLSEYAFHGDVELFAHTLQFFLDCMNKDTEGVVFFWPQLQNLHLQMLPPMDVELLRKVEIMEDFLLTAATKYSVHLALELVWGYVADLEDSLFHTNCVSKIRRRRFSVLRFVCELESLLFDFADGWGGGSVSLRNMLTPSPHQVSILKNSFTELTRFRKRESNFLSISTRMEKLEKNKFQKPPQQAAADALKAAKDADYFSSHLSFCRRICDVAEKLFDVDPEQRKATLEKELIVLNASGAMGGDPLNQVNSNLKRVVRIPTTEGHVFRSKERTPVLLLMEVVEELPDEEEEEKVTKKVDAKQRQQDQHKQDLARDGPSEAEANHRRASHYAVDLELPIEEGKGGTDDEVDEDLESSNKQEQVTNGSGNEELVDAMNEVSLDDDEEMEHPTKVRTFSADLQPEAVKVPASPRALSKFKRTPIVGDDSTTSLDYSKTPDKISMEKLVNDVMISQIEMPDLKEEPQDSAKPKTPTNRKSSALGDNSNGTLNSGKKEDIRREVLTAIMTKGLRKDHSIAVGAATAAQKSLQELERKKAVAMILNGDKPELKPKYAPPGEEHKEKEAAELQREQLRQELDSTEVTTANAQSEEDEVIDALRLLLIQNHVASTTTNANGDVDNSTRSSVRNVNAPLKPDGTVDKSEIIEIDAGDVDPRLAGCGALPPAVLSALTLWKGGVVNTTELLELVKKDIQYTQQIENPASAENSAFWGRFAFGERWAEKKARISAGSPEGNDDGWDLAGVIVKANDDLRQEAFVMQLIELCQEAFELAELDLWVAPYKILATGRTTGIIECVRNAMSFDALKKRPGYGKKGLRGHLQRMTEFSPDPEKEFKMMQHNFVKSLAAYSLMSFFFMFKDRHNGNILLDTAGHVIHIDFGFVFGIAPGGAFSLEMSTPFKLTEEMMDVMEGMESPFFSEFVTLFCCGFLALQAHMDTFLTLVEITCAGSSFNCFRGRDPVKMVQELRARFCPDLTKEQTVAFALDQIKQATHSYGTKQYDYFQYLSQGIAA